MLLKLLCDPGDEVLVPAPSYPLFGPLATFEGVTPVPYRLAYDGAWHVDLASLRAARTERTRAVFAVSPNNPTGSVVSQAELEAFVELGLPIVIDEVFLPYTFREAPRARVDGALVFRLGGLSKLAALPQMKLAWIVVEGDEAPGALAGLEWISDAYLSCAAPVQHALPMLLAASAVTRDAIRARTRRNLDALRAAVAGTALTVLDVEGGWYACVRLPGTRSEESWCLELLERGTLVHPGHFFDFDREAFAIVSLLAPPDELDRGVAALTDVVHRLA
jgi:aspartate/methionine/tyrosine aminotransferase